MPVNSHGAEPSSPVRQCPSRPVRHHTLHPHYSDLISSSGSMPAARRAARNEVSSAAATTNAATPSKVVRLSKR